MRTFTHIALGSRTGSQVYMDREEEAEKLAFAFCFVGRDGMRKYWKDHTPHGGTADPHKLVADLLKTATDQL